MIQALEVAQRLHGMIDALHGDHFQPGNLLFRWLARGTTAFLEAASPLSMSRSCPCGAGAHLARQADFAEHRDFSRESPSPLGRKRPRGRTARSAAGSPMRTPPTR
jgi:hypothetical protein